MKATALKDSVCQSLIDTYRVTSRAYTICLSNETYSTNRQPRSLLGEMSKACLELLSADDVDVRKPAFQRRISKIEEEIGNARNRLRVRSEIGRAHV